MQKLIFSFLMALASLSAPLQASEPASTHAKITQEVNDWLSTSLSNSPGAFSFELRPVDSRLKLDGCTQREISLPQGNRLVGNTMLRVRCIEGANWMFNLPVKISIQVQYAVAARPLAANQEISTGDIAIQQGDLATLPGSVILDPATAIGRALNSPVAAGQTLRQEQLRTAMAISQNQKVKIIFRQDGIEISNEGIAMNAAAEGQPVRVRLDKGKTITGTAQLGGIVDVGP
nr:flagellar basal body P-ring formation chaperone FlgA [uncultured Deefgea sp.]